MNLWAADLGRGLGEGASRVPAAMRSGGDLVRDFGPLYPHLVLLGGEEGVLLARVPPNVTTLLVGGSVSSQGVLGLPDRHHRCVEGAAFILEVDITGTRSL
jgi:hypothetical protein